MGERVAVSVRCHSGYTYAQRPVQVEWLGEWLDVKDVVNEWRTPEGWAFKVVCTNQMVFELYYNEATEEWSAV